MPNYRCCFLDDAKRTIKVELQDCPDDIAARRWADGRFRQNPHYAMIEIWLDDRLIERRQHTPLSR